MVFCHSELDRWNSPERFIGSLVVIALSPFLGHAPDLIERLEDIAIQYLSAISAIKPFDKSILRWFCRTK